MTVTRRLTDINDSISAMGTEALIEKAFHVSKELTAYIDNLKRPLKKLISSDSVTDKNFHQKKLHGLAWYATYAEALKSISSWAYELSIEEKFGALERLIFPFRLKLFLGPLTLNFMFISPIIESISEMYVEINSAERKEPSV